MQKQANAKRYIFDAHATGVAGQITHPFQDIVGIQAASALPATGGLGSARTEGFRYKEILSVGSAYTEVVGTETHDGTFETLAFSVVEKFNLLDIVTCDRIVARLTGSHVLKPDGSPGETSILPIGSRFEKLRIGNQYFERLEVAPYFCQPERASWSGLQKAADDKEERPNLVRLSLLGQDEASARLKEGYARGVLGFRALVNPESQDQPDVPHLFSLSQFGTVHFGEFFCYPKSRHLTMLRVELGCPVQGGFSACDTIVDGEPYPP